MLTRAEEKLLFALRRRKFREAEGLLLAEGERVAGELLDAGLPTRLAVITSDFEDTPAGRGIVQRLEPLCPVRRVDARRLAALAATETPQGILIVAEAPCHRLEDLELAEGETGLVLDGIQDPGNFGTLARSAAALGARFVVALPGTVDPWNPKSVRAAAGASFRLPIVQTSAEELVAWSRERDVQLYGADSRGIDVEQCEFADRAALVLGNEGAGLSPVMREAVAALVAVPMPGGAESLNVAVAAGILLYVMTRRR